MTPNNQDTSSLLKQHVFNCDCFPVKCRASPHTTIVYGEVSSLLTSKLSKRLLAGGCFCPRSTMYSSSSGDRHVFKCATHTKLQQ